MKQKRQKVQGGAGQKRQRAQGDAGQKRQRALGVAGQKATQMTDNARPEGDADDSQRKYRGLRR